MSIRPCLFCIFFFHFSSFGFVLHTFFPFPLWPIFFLHSCKPLFEFIETKTKTTTAKAITTAAAAATSAEPATILVQLVDCRFCSSSLSFSESFAPLEMLCLVLSVYHLSLVARLFPSKALSWKLVCGSDGCLYKRLYRCVAVVYMWIAFVYAPNSRLYFEGQLIYNDAHTHSHIASASMYGCTDMYVCVYLCVRVSVRVSVGSAFVRFISHSFCKTYIKYRIKMAVLVHYYYRRVCMLLLFCVTLQHCFCCCCSAVGRNMATHISNELCHFGWNDFVRILCASVTKCFIKTDQSEHTAEVAVWRLIVSQSKLIINDMPHYIRFVYESVYGCNVFDSRIYSG